MSSSIFRPEQEQLKQPAPQLKADQWSVRMNQTVLRPPRSSQNDLTDPRQSAL
ncbi:MAG: hypothetical protein MK110_10685 [Fuerstiella sp.]|nr:hypothetical protein [Fuerstiella sp.]